MTQTLPSESEEHLRRAIADRNRLDALRSTGLLDAPPQEAFDRLVDLATKLLGVPVAVVSLVEPERQFFLAGSGIGEPWKGQRGTPISHSFCKHVVADDKEMVVEDARESPILKDNPAVEELDAIAYAGTPLRLSTGEVLGTFCAIDHEPRQWSEAQLEALRTLAAAAMAEVELRVASRSLAEREARFRGTLEQIRAFAVTLDENGTITFVNDYFLEMTDWTREEVMGRDWFDFVPRDGDARDAYRREIAAGTVAPRNDGLVVTRAGEQRLVAWDNIPLHDAEGKTVGVAGIGHDVTVQRQAERLKNELIGIVSHELRGPLTAIRASLRLIEPQTVALDDKAQRMVGIASRNTDRLVSVVNDLLDLDRIESGEMPMEYKHVAVNCIIDDACEEMTPIADEAGVVLTHECSCNGQVNVDSDRIVQALTNLIRNAISFSRQGSSVEVSARGANNSAIFEVRDHGRGIPPEKISAIFERFKQVQSSDHRERTGTGLGLAICRAIVEQLGGEISVESKVGEGSTFRISLPLVS